ncbi:MAG: hypothetical protein M1815_003215 [Lichina confinis]|nr:MAG: hypothetical protein M1815_003215 [Lichina confinis]
MATVNQQRLRGRPAHTPGPTYISYTPDGASLVTAGSNNAIRVYNTGSVGEPVTIDDCQELNTAIAAGSDFFLAGSEDGAVSRYSLRTNDLQQVLVRCTLPIRDVALSPDGRWAAVASDELEVKLVDVQDMTRVRHLRQQTKAVKHLSFHPSGMHLAVSCSDGILYIYSLSREEPELVTKIDGLIRSLETDHQATSKAVWHPDGRAFAVPTATRDVQVVSMDDWARQRTFSNGHTADITAVAWSPNGAFLVTAAADGKILLWDSKSQNILVRYDYSSVVALAWHPLENVFCFANTEGEVFIHPDFVPSEQLPLLRKNLQPAPFIHDPLGELSVNTRKPAIANGDVNAPHHRRKRARTPDSLDDILPPDSDDDDQNDFIEDDDGAGYAEAVNGFGKRPRALSITSDRHGGKRRAVRDLWGPEVHEPFQPGSTPWRGLNLIGCAWTVDQDTHHTVTVEFYDREFHRDFHFTDAYRYDMACLNDAGALFACPPHDGRSATIFYRPHEMWTTRADWRTQLPEGEHVVAMSLSDSYVVVATSADYVRVFTLYGTPFRVYRQKSTPTVTCASWRDYVLTMGNGAVGGDGSTRLLYTIENVRRDEVCQSEDTVALPQGTTLKSVFFSDKGDPHIYDSDGVLLVLLHWRAPGQARWVPVLDTRQLSRLAGGRKQESYWPVAIMQDRFHCIILKGGDKHPFFPRPLISEFDFKVPLSSVPGAEAEPNNDDSQQQQHLALEESFVRHTVALDLLDDLYSVTDTTSSQRAERARKQAEIDKALLQLLAIECREGEERGMKALEIVGLMRDRSGKMLEAATKIAERYDRTMLVQKIRGLAESRLALKED